MLERQHLWESSSGTAVVSAAQIPRLCRQPTHMQKGIFCSLVKLDIIFGLFYCQMFVLTWSNCPLTYFFSGPDKSMTSHFLIHQSKGQATLFFEKTHKSDLVYLFASLVVISYCKFNSKFSKHLVVSTDLSYSVRSCKLNPSCLTCCCFFPHCSTPPTISFHFVQGKWILLIASHTSTQVFLCSTTQTETHFTPNLSPSPFPKTTRLCFDSVLPAGSLLFHLTGLSLFRPPSFWRNLNSSGSFYPNNPFTSQQIYKE